MTFPPDNSTAPPGSTPVTSAFWDLCGFIGTQELERIPRQVVSHARLVLIDTLGVILAGSGSKEIIRLAQKKALNGRSSGGATCPGRRRRYSLLNAAMINGMAGSSLEFEEGNSRAMGHPAVQVVPGVVSWAEIHKLSWTDVLRGFILGYEAACRVSRSSTMRRGLHPTGTWGVIGAALGVGALRTMDSAALYDIANIAAAYAMAPYVKNSFSGYSSASTFAGLANHSGVLSNLFHDSGIKADPHSFEMTFSSFVSESFDPETLTVGLGTDYAISQNYFKPYPTCRFTHPALDALGAILEEQPVVQEEIETIRLISFKAAVHTGKDRPANVEAMRFSVPYLLGCMLLHGKIELKTLTPDLLEDTRLSELADKVELVHSKEYEKLCPANYPARIELQLKDGRSLSRTIMDCRGDPGNPLSETHIHEKIRRLAEPVIGPTSTRDFLANTAHRGGEDDVRTLMTLLRPDNASEIQEIAVGDEI